MRRANEFRHEAKSGVPPAPLTPEEVTDLSERVNKVISSYIQHLYWSTNPTHITVIAFTGAQERARASAASATLKQVAEKIDLYTVDSGTYPSTLADAGITDTASTTLQYSSSPGAPGAYCLTSTNGSTSYWISNTSQTPTKGGCPGRSANGVATITNFVTNPSFENGRTSWSWADGSGYTGTTSNLQAFSGPNSFAISAPAIGSTTYDRYLEANIALTTSGTYTISGYVYLTGGGMTFGNRDTLLGCASGSCTGDGTIAYNHSTLNQWQRIAATVTISGSATVRIRFYGCLGGTTYIDGVMVSDGQSNFADGNTTNWVWDGPQNASTSHCLPQA